MSRGAWIAVVALIGCSSSTTTQDGPSGGPHEPGPGDAGSGDADAGDVAPVEIGPGWLRGEHPEDLPGETHVIGAAAHEAADEARARAIIGLEREVWGPVPERPSFHSLPAIFVEGDVVRREALEDGRTAVLVAVTREAIGNRIEEWMDAAATEYLREGVADEAGARIEAALARLKGRTLEKFGCERRRTVARQECQPAPSGDSPLRMVATLVQLRPALEGGIPHFPDQPPLRPAGARLSWQTQEGETIPWPGAPLTFEAPEGVLAADAATTDADGYAAVAFAGELADDATIAVALDAGQIFGEFAPDWPGAGIELRLREVTNTNARIAVHLFENISQEATDERTTAEAVVARLKRLGYGGALVLPLELTPALEDARSGKFKEAVQKLADAASGKADIIVMGEANSDFLSRAVGRSVWHEAIGTVKVYDLWTGRHIGDAERETRAKGMGDFNAARKAMKALGEDLAVAVHDLVSEGELTYDTAPSSSLATR